MPFTNGCVKRILEVFGECSELLGDHAVPPEFFEEASVWLNTDPKAQGRFVYDLQHPVAGRVQMLSPKFSYANVWGYKTVVLVYRRAADGSVLEHPDPLLTVFLNNEFFRPRKNGGMIALDCWGEYEGTYPQTTPVEVSSIDHHAGVLRLVGSRSVIRMRDIAPYIVGGDWSVLNTLVSQQIPILVYNSAVKTHRQMRQEGALLPNPYRFFRSQHETVN